MPRSQQEQQVKLNSPSPRGASVRLPLAVALAATALWPLAAGAQIRVYDDKAGSSTAAPSGGGTLGGVRSESAAPLKTTNSDNNGTHAISLPPATVPVPARPSPTSSLTPQAAAAPAAASATLPLLATPPTRLMPQLAPSAPETPVGQVEVLVFTKVSEFSPIVVARLKAVSQIPGIKPVYYVDSLMPMEYLSLGNKGIDQLPEDIEMEADSDGAIAEAYGVKRPNTIIVRLPSGAIRSYNLLNELELFKSHITREISAPST